MNLRFAVVGLLGVVVGACAGAGASQDDAKSWVDTFTIDKCTHQTAGKNRYWVLEPGYQVVVASNTTQVAITVTQKTQKVNGIETRIVEETEFEDGKLKEISRNFYTICKEHNNVYYHGEEVDDYKDGKIVGHGGAWQAGVKGARAGLMMPGKVSVGYKHYQEVAPAVAMDRAEIETDDALTQTPAGEFKQCLRVKETTPLEPGTALKIYAPDVGLIMDDDMVLVDRGTGRVPPTAPLDIKADLAGALSEVEVPEDKAPAAITAALKKLHPTGKVKEIKREEHRGGKILYAIEIVVDGAQWDVELAPDGKVLVNKKE